MNDEQVSSFIIHWLQQLTKGDAFYLKQMGVG